MSFCQPKLGCRVFFVGMDVDGKGSCLVFFVENISES